MPWALANHFSDGTEEEDSDGRSKRSQRERELSTYGAALDLDESIPGAETERQRYRGCAGNIFVELWTVYGSDHPHLWDLAVAEREGTTQVALAAWEWLRTKKK